MLNQNQYKKLQSMGLSPSVVNQVVQRAGGVEQKKSISGFLGNVAGSGSNVVGDIANSVLHPIDTAKSLIGLGKGVVQLLIPGEQGNEDLARQVGQFYVDRYGSVEKAKNSFYKDPVGVAMDASVILGGTGGLLKAGGSLAKSSKLAKLGSTVSKAGAIADPLNFASKSKLIPSRFKPNIGGKLRSKIADFGDTYAIKSTRINDRNQTKLAKQMKGMKTKYGNNLESLVETTGLYGQDLNAVDNYLKPLEDLRNSKIIGSGATVESGEILKNFGNKIAELSTPESMRDPASRLLRERLIEEAKQYAQQNPVRRSPLSLESLNTTRKMIDDNTPNAQFESEKSALQRSLGNVYRDTVNSSAQTGEIGKELSVLYKYRDMLSKAPKGKNTLPMGITQSIATGTGLLSGGNPLSRVANAAIGYGATSLVNSPKFIGKVSKVAKNVSNYKAPKTMSKFLNYGNKAINTGYNYGKVGRMIPNLDNGQDKLQPLPTQTEVKRPLPYKPSISQSKFTVEQFKTKKPKSVFNNAAFGKTFTLKKGSFN